MIMRLEHLVYKARLREVSFFSLEKSSRSHCSVQLPREDGARLFLEVYSKMTTADKLKHEKF